MSIREQNQEAIRRFLESTAELVDIRLARDVVPGMDQDYLIYHAGPPVTWDKMCGPMRGATIGACLFEGWTKSPEEVDEIAKNGKLKFAPSHEHSSIGPMSGIITPSMYVNVVRNAKFDIETYSTLYMGVGKVLRHGAHDEEVIAKLQWMNSELAETLKAVLERAGGIDLKQIIAQSLQMGDELHNRNKASNALLQCAIFPHLVRVTSDEKAERIANFIEEAGHFILNSVMAGCKAMLESAKGLDGSTLVTTIARNGVETGIRVAGLGDQWFTAPAPKIDGVYFPGYGPEDANPDMGDSAITETMGLGSLAMAGAPAVVQLVGGTPKFAVETSMKMYEITIAEHDMFRIPHLDFRGTPLGIDVRKVVETGITPVINTGIAHRKPGIGQIGAGLTAVPMECFTKALKALGAAKAA